MLSAARRVNLSFLVLFLFLVLQTGVQGAGNILREEIESRLNYSAAVYQGIAAEIGGLVPDPHQTMANPDSPTLKKAFRMMHQFYTGSARRFLPSIKASVEKQFAADFFAGFFNAEDNDPELLNRMNRLVGELVKAAGRSDLAVQVGILSGGGIMGFAKGGEWIVITDEMARWPEEEIAGVVAHEMCHLFKRDFTKIILNGCLNARLLAFFPENKRDAYKKLLELFANRWKRFCEYETDIHAVDLMRKSGLAPEGLIRVLQKIGGADVDPKQYLLLDHPSITERVKAIRTHLNRR